MQPIGLYLHVPFCASKCPYCDFYSMRGTEETMDAYTDALLRSLDAFGADGQYTADTLYFGGGTPSLLGGERLVRLITRARGHFGLQGGEITVECNPASTGPALLKALSDAGVNRISLGMQSAVDTERRMLGRRSTAQEIETVTAQARQAGIHNISLDLMLGVPGQTEESLHASLDFCLSLGAAHVSAYLLKLEEGTAFYRRRAVLDLPEEDAVCDFYLHTVKRMEAAGLPQYEISNFAKPGYESLHNLKYWRDEPYLGLGPSAHSFLGGKRFYFTKNLADFLRGTAPMPDGDGGSFEEFCMLRLRLTEGLKERDIEERFGFGIPNEMRKKADKLAKNGLLYTDDKGIALSPKGFLLSNRVIGSLLV